MTRPTLGQLSYRQEAANHHVHRGSHFRHQPSGKVYEITGHCIREEDGEVLVLYRPIECDARLERIFFQESSISSLVFSRPLSDWFTHAEWHDGEAKQAGPRFKEVVRSPGWVNV